MALKKVFQSWSRLLVGLESPSVIQNKLIHCTCYNMRDVVDRKEMLRSLPKIDEGTAGEKAGEMDILLKESVVILFIDLSVIINNLFQ